MRTAHIEVILRQQDPVLTPIVEELAHGEVRDAIASLIGQGRVDEIENHDQRICQIETDYMRQPEGTLAVSSDNQSRREINEQIHRAMQEGCLNCCLSEV